LKNPLPTSAGELAKVVDPEFKPQYCKKNKAWTYSKGITITLNPQRNTKANERKLAFRHNFIKLHCEELIN
jgi:hypothetical protein